MTRTSPPHAKWQAAGIALAACLVAQWPAHAATPAAPANSTTCVACHGSQGEVSATGVPRLAGQNAQYLEHALSMFKAKTRASSIMQPIASGLSDADMHELATYFAGLHGSRVPAAAPPPADLVRAGEQLARVGAVSDSTPACFSCHAANGGHSDNARFPSIAGQPAAFTVDRLHEFQGRAKGTTPDPQTMTAVSTHLNEDQIRQVSAYLSTLPPP